MDNAALDLRKLADLVMVYQIEGDDDVHVNVCGIKIGAFGPLTGKAVALLKYDAARRAALSKAQGATP